LGREKIERERRIEDGREEEGEEMSDLDQSV